MQLRDDILALHLEMSRLRGLEGVRDRLLGEAPDLPLALHTLETECRALAQLLDPEGKEMEGKGGFIALHTMTSRVLAPGEELPDEFK